MNQGVLRAADGNRTRDLRTTNATLYRLSHSSMLGEASLSITKRILSKVVDFVNTKLHIFFKQNQIFVIEAPSPHFASSNTFILFPKLP